MSMRRSRLQVKPNLGARGTKAAGRAGKADEKASANPVSPRKSPARSKEPVKSPDKPTPELPQVKSPSESKIKPSERLKSIRSPSYVKSEQSQVIALSSVNTDTGLGKLSDQDFSCKEESLTKIKDKTNPIPADSEKNESSSLTKDYETIEPKPPPASKPLPRLRSRFNRAKPNLSEAGKSRSRKAVVEEKTVTALPSVQPEACVEERPVVQCLPVPGPDPQLLSAEPPHSVLDVVDGGEVTTAAEVTVSTESAGPAEEEVFIPNGRPDSPPTRVASPAPSSVAESEMSRTADSVDMPSPTQPVRKARKRPTKVLAPVDQPPDKCKMLMKDLIYWNPITNPMKVKEKKSRSTGGSVAGESVSERTLEDTPPSGAPEAGEDASLPVPQVKIGPDGSIVLNEESLVIDRKSDQSEMSDAGVVEETDSLITYASFRTRHLSKTWTEKETERFFYALSVVGTDFSMMSNLFKHRDRYDLKKKFKREEKYNRKMVDKALDDRKTFDKSVFENISDEREDEPKKKRRKKAKAQGSSKVRGPGKSKENNGGEVERNGKPNKKKKTSRKKAKRSQFYCEDTDEEEEEEIPHSDEVEETVFKEACPDGIVGGAEPLMDTESVPTRILELEDDDEGEELHRTLPRPDEAHSSDEDELRVLDSICQVTRSGRIPKKTSFFKTGSESPNRKRASVENATRSQGTNTMAESDVVSNPQIHKESPKNAITKPFLQRTTTHVIPPKTASESMEIHNVQNIPSAGGSQLVLVTQKGGEDAAGGQGTVIHVYMLSPTTMRSPEWPGSPRQRPSPQTYSGWSNFLGSPKPSPHGTPQARGAVSPAAVQAAVSTSTENQTEQPLGSEILEPPPDTDET